MSAFASVDLRGLAERNLQRLLESGPGIHAYALHKAAGLEKEMPEFFGLVSLVEEAIGPAATEVARRDIGILLGINTPRPARATTTRRA